MRTVATHRRQSLTGDDFREMFVAGTRWLERNVSSVNLLNVFPVPDGDTGTNMLLTMRAAISEAQDSPGNNVSDIVNSMAKGSFMGARGNSGVILSQIFRGLARSIANKQTIGSKDLAAALSEAKEAAYKGVSEPVEGTMLTVMKDAADAAQQSLPKIVDPVETLAITVSAAKESVSRTPHLLAILREAGVVDAGGQGLYIVLEGALNCLRGEAPEPEPMTDPASLTHETPTKPTPTPSLIPKEPTYGYCTEFHVHGQAIDINNVRLKMAALGDSVIVVGDDNTIKVHLHTLDPGPTLSYGNSLGNLRQIKIDNIDEQHQEYKATGRTAGKVLTLATIVVASGKGFSEIFESLGATKIVSGGPTMNPSVRELLTAVEETDADQVILLPNDPNIIMAAEQVKTSTNKKLHVIPSKNIPQGISALLSANSDADFSSNIRQMSEATRRVKTGQITKAIRPTNLKGHQIKKGQLIGILENDLAASGQTLKAIFRGLLKKMDVPEGGIITVYYGENATKEEADELAHWATSNFLGTDIEVLNGGQPHSHFIISVE